MSVVNKTVGKGQAEKGMQTAAQQKRTLTTSQSQQTQPFLLATDTFDIFDSVLEVIPSEDWCRTWATDRTIMLRSTSKRVKEVVNKILLPALVLLSRRSWDYDTTTLKIEMKHLTVVSVRCCITTLELPHCGMEGQDAQRLAGVLPQCPALTHLDLSGNKIGTAGEEILDGVLGQCTVLTHLDLSHNHIGSDGVARLAGVLVQCPALAHLNLVVNPHSWGRVSCRSVGTVCITDSPRSRLQFHWSSRDREPCKSAAVVHSADSPRTQSQPE